MFSLLVFFFFSGSSFSLTSWGISWLLDLLGAISYYGLHSGSTHWVHKWFSTPVSDGFYPIHDKMIPSTEVGFQHRDSQYPLGIWNEEYLPGFLKHRDRLQNWLCKTDCWGSDLMIGTISRHPLGQGCIYYDVLVLIHAVCSVMVSL